MADRGIEAVRAHLAKLPPSDTLTVAERRLQYERAERVFPIPPEIKVEQVSAPTAPAEWLRPPGAVAGRIVLYLHGGGYVIGSPRSHRHLAAAIASAGQATGLLLDYRLAPEHPFPAAVEDALSAYRWLAEQRPVVLAGDSAGAGLMFSLLVTLRAQGLPLPAGVVCLSPGFDLTGAPEMISGDAETLTMLRRGADAYLAGHPADDPVVNPLAADLTGMPPLLIQAGTGDFALPQARALADRASAFGVDVRLELYPVDTHVFHVFWSFLPEAADALAQAGAFMREVLAGERTAAAPERQR